MLEDDQVTGIHFPAGRRVIVIEHADRFGLATFEHQPPAFGPQRFRQQPAELARHLERRGRKGPVRVVAGTPAALREIQKNRKTDFCICGSLYLAGDVLKYLGGKTDL